MVTPAPIASATTNDPFGSATILVTSGETVPKTGCGLPKGQYDPSFLPAWRFCSLANGGLSVFSATIPTRFECAGKANAFTLRRGIAMFKPCSASVASP